MSSDERNTAGLGDRVEDLLGMQQALFERLEALGLRQGELIDGDDSAGLLELLAQRQRLIDSIAEVSATLEPFRARWSSLVRSLPEAERYRLNRRLDILADLAGRIAVRDEADRARLERRRDAVGAELTWISRWRGAVAAYGGAGGDGPAPRFQDREA